MLEEVKPENNMLAHLAYVSSRKSNCSDQEIEKILSACEKNNPSLDITGVLMYSDKQFIQYVEGESSALTSLYDKIKLDNRHERAVMISYGPIEKKIFPSWHMANRKISNNDVDFLTDINNEDKLLFDKILKGKEAEGSKVQSLLTKFFKK
jgi:hypothetical protein